MYNYNGENGTKQNICKFLIGVFTIVIFICLVAYSDTESDYISAKADVARQKIDSLQSNIWNLNPSADTSELDKVMQKRYICIGGIVVSSMGIVICGIVLYGARNGCSKKKQYVAHTNTYLNSNSGTGTQSKLQELESMYEKNLITEEEYSKKKQDLLNKM